MGSSLYRSLSKLLAADFHLYPRVRQLLKRRPFRNADAMRTARKTVLKALKETCLRYTISRTLQLLDRVHCCARLLRGKK